MPDNPLDSMHHVAVSVDDIAAAVAWYTSRFSCSVSYQDDSWAMLDFANVQLALVSAGQHPAHIAFEHPSPGDFGEPVTHRDGTSSVYVTDSAGNAIELVQRTK